MRERGRGREWREREVGGRGEGREGGRGTKSLKMTFELKWKGQHQPVSPLALR